MPESIRKPERQSGTQTASWSSRKRVPSPIVLTRDFKSSSRSEEPAFTPRWRTKLLRIISSVLKAGRRRGSGAAPSGGQEGAFSLSTAEAKKRLEKSIVQEASAISIPTKVVLRRSVED